MKKGKKARIYKDVEFLTNIRPYRNYRNTGSLERVCAYLKDEIQNCGLEFREQEWFVSNNSYKNIIATYNSEKQKRLIVGAHYDVCGEQPGADDNASAVAGLLETIRLISENKPELDYRIDFVAYCLEEPPNFGTENMGSFVHAKSLYENKVDVIGMICYEMIGYFSDKPDSQPLPVPELAALYPHTANFIIVVGLEKYKEFNSKFHSMMSEDSEIDVQKIDFSESDELAVLAGLSDQISYWRFGYNALMINDTAFVRNPNYHEITDTIETLDFDKLTEVVNSAYRGIISMK
jgi:hypothetical protein